ncbi:hypothetical protein HELRODRAFT_160113 [Helobdella robusta]|uniref:Uncharacterized protein n=1 Tax=Helobdella robusta TaxID=6412 RepID=T1EPT6_HELRO|nr:hypothetical protein HELRODRAFT_160113 [Helobdella robusta]ESO06007.1 hypothetical protein HELRODRAFT_160113 [Helobdella robusta]
MGNVEEQLDRCQTIKTTLKKIWKKIETFLQFGERFPAAGTSSHNKNCPEKTGTSDQLIVKCYSDGQLCLSIRSVNLRKIEILTIVQVTTTGVRSGFLINRYTNWRKVLRKQNLDSKKAKTFLINRLRDSLKNKAESKEMSAKMNKKLEILVKIELQAVEQKMAAEMNRKHDRQATEIKYKIYQTKFKAKAFSYG